MYTCMDEEKKWNILSIVFSIVGIILSIIKKDFLIFITVLNLTIAAIVFTYLAKYTNQTNNNSEDIQKIKDNFKIVERLLKLETKVFGK